MHFKSSCFLCHPVYLTVRTLYYCVGNVICYFMYHHLLKKLWCISVKFLTGIMAAVFLIWCVFILLMVLNRPCGFLALHCCCCCVLFLALHCCCVLFLALQCCCCRILFLTVCSCFLLSTAIVHRKTSFISSLLFDKHTVVFTLYVRGGLFTRSVVSSQMYITTETVVIYIQFKPSNPIFLKFILILFSSIDDHKREGKTGMIAHLP